MALLVLVAAVVTALVGASAFWVLGRSSPARSPERDAAAVPSPERARSTPTREQPSATPTPSPTPTAPGGFPALFDEVKSGVVMLRASTCEGDGVGSGFLVSATEVVTAAHVVEGATSVGVVQGDDTYTAGVVGLDTDTDVALLKVREPIPGHVFEMSHDLPRPGAQVAVIGHPLGEPLTITNGSVSRVDRALWPQIQLDVSVSPGNSGGPVVTDDGTVLGVIQAKDVEAEGLAYALRSDVLTPVVDGSETLPAADAAACANPLGPEDAEAAPLPDSSELDRAAARTLANYFGGINSGDYRLAYDQLSPARRSAAGFESFKEGVATSYDFDFQVADVTPNADGAVVWLEFVSLQSPSEGPQGESCTEWSLDYELVWGSGGRMFIDAAKPHGGDGHRPCL